MSLRFTDTCKWRDPWYMDLSVTLKCLWNYVCDCCDNAGVWPVNKKLAEFEIGTVIDWTDALETFRDRVQPLDDGRKWYLIKFIRFQYPGGLGESRPHQQVRRLLSGHGIDSDASSVSSLYPLDRLGGRLPERSMSAPRLDQTRPDQMGGMQGGARIALRPILAEFGLPTSPVAFAEWKHGLAEIARCRSADDVRTFLRSAIDLAAKHDLKVEYFRHVESFAVEWSGKPINGNHT